MKDKVWHLYKITNSINEKIYIGVTSRPEDRKKVHFYNRSQPARSLIKNAIDKYGVDKFNFEIICTGGREYIYDLEAKAISLYSTISPNGYNIKPGGEGGPGHKVKFKVNDNPVYVTGFWFPNMRTATEVTGINKTTIYRRLKKGTAGDVVIKSNKNILLNQFVYVGGIWFPCISIASECLGFPVSTLRKRIRDGSLEQQYKPKVPKGEENYFYGRTGALCHNSKPVEVEGVYYVSIKEASRATGYDVNKITKFLKDGHPEFLYK